MECVIEYTINFDYNGLMGQRDQSLEKAKKAKPCKKTSETDEIAELCLNVRTLLNLTKKEMAKELGTTERTYRRWEAGEGKPSAEAAGRLFQLHFAFNSAKAIFDLAGIEVHFLVKKN